MVEKKTKEIMNIAGFEVPIEGGIVEFKVIYNPYSLEEIEKFILTLGSDDLPAFGGTFMGGVYLQQVPSELASCIKAILDSGKEIKSYLEIGVAAGGMAFIINHFFKPSRIVLIDDNQHPKSKLRPSILQGIVTEQAIGNSHEQRVIDSVTGSFDLVFFDGDTGYEATMADVSNYASKLTKGGFLALHDTANKGFGVCRAVKELAQGYDFTLVGEWIESTTCGIALFRKEMDTNEIFKKVTNKIENLTTNIPGLITQNEFQWLYEKAHGMETILEIGAWKGKSTFSLLSGCKGIVWSVDHFRGSPLEINGAEREAQDGKIKDIFLQNVGHFSNLHLLEMDSLDAVKQFKEKSIDMIFIDGDHRLEAVRLDLKVWYPICKKLFCGHDYDPGHPGVVQAVDELGMNVVVGPDWIWSMRIK